MRHASFYLLTPLLFIATQGHGQTLGDVEQRLDRLEGQVQSVQRKVLHKEFPLTEEEQQAAANAAKLAEATQIFGELSRRMDLLERQIAAASAQNEDVGFKARSAAEDNTKFRGDAEFRITALEERIVAMQKAIDDSAIAQRQATVAAAAKPVVPTAPAPTPEAAKDPIEGEYIAAYDFVVKEEWNKAEYAFATFVQLHPKHARSSESEFWLGRSLLAQSKAPQAAATFLKNYQASPNGTMAADSLVWLGKSLLAIGPDSHEQACDVYGQLETSFGDKLTAAQRTDMLQGRLAANCK